MSDLTKLVGLNETLENTGSDNVRLYFITRHLKEGVSASARVLDKYDFRCVKVDLSERLQSHFHGLLKRQIQASLSNNDLTVSQYTVVDDDLQDKVYTYALNNALSFSDVISNQLLGGVSIRSVSSLEEVQNDLVAYCISVETANLENSLFSFRRISKTKVATEDKKNFLKCVFNTSDTQLDIFEGENVSFDDKIDCMYVNGEFFVFYKKQFEQLLGLDEEFKKLAEDVIDEIEQTNFFTGLEKVKDEIQVSKMTLRKLASIAKSGNYKDIDNGRIDQMKKLCTDLNLNLRFEV